MNSPSDDEMFSRYRTELAMDAEARARTFRKLQERVLRGEQPGPEIDVLPPQTAALRGLWSLPAKWVVTITGLSVAALLVANVAVRGAPLTAAGAERALVAPSVQSTAAMEGRALVLSGAQSTAAEGRSGSALAPEQGSDQRVVAMRAAGTRASAGTEAASRAQAKSPAPAARVTSARVSTELAKHSGNAARAEGPQLTAATRTHEAGSPLASATRAQEQTSPLNAATRLREVGAWQASTSRAQDQRSPLEGAESAQGTRSQTAAGAARGQEQSSPLSAAARAQELGSLSSDAAQAQVSAAGESSQPSAAAPSSKAQKPAYASPKEREALPQRSDKEIASETLSKEVQLLQAAQLALRAGDTQRSLALLAEHTWTYPQGHLAEARDVARILALCQAGNVAQSNLHAKRFLQQRPESPYALRVRAGCAAMTDASDPRREPTP